VPTWQLYNTHGMHSKLTLHLLPALLQVVTDFCSQHLPRNTAAFKDPRMKLINDDARTQLEVGLGTSQQRGGSGPPVQSATAEVQSAFGVRSAWLQQGTTTEETKHSREEGIQAWTA
jgi:hypothetical protein